MSILSNAGSPANPVPYTVAMNNYLLRIPVAYAVAVAVAAVLGCAGSTQSVLAGLQGLGIDVPLADRLSATVHDIVGMGPLYALIAAVAFLPAFAIAATLLRWVPGPRPFWFAVAGGAAIVSAILIIRYVVGGTVIGGARSASGLLVQALACAVAGWLFARLLDWRHPA